MKNNKILTSLGLAFGVIIYDVISHGFNNIDYLKAIFVGLFYLMLTYFLNKRKA